MALSLLKRILKAAEERGQQVDRAIYGIRIAKADEREPRFLTWEEAEELQSWMPEYVCRIVPVAILTMLRRAEILGLRDGDIDFASGSIAVFSQHQDGERVKTKTRAGRRTVDVGPRSLALLREQQLARSPGADGYLFPAPEGGPFDGDNFFSRVFKPAARHAGMPELTFHDLRHTGASLMIAAGRQGDRRADGSLGRRDARPTALRTPLQGRRQAGGNRAGIASFRGTEKFCRTIHVP
jgi:integrase